MARAFLFAGQGAQKVGMAAETTHLDKVKALFDLAEKKLSGIVKLMLEGEPEQLNRTINTQPAMFLADLAYAYLADSGGGEAQAVCGFSVGEIPALCYAGALSLSDGLDVIIERARLMDEACLKNRGKMIAVIGLTPQRAEQLAAAVKDCWAVNYNAPQQTVLAVSEESADELIKLAAAEKGRALPLKVSGAFHCPYMESASEGLKELLKGIEFKSPRIPVYSNLTAKPYGGDGEHMKELLYRQVCSPVRFTDTIANMKADGVDEFIEVGPGNVLTGLLKKIGG